jgi:hypothetical protein
MKQIDTYSSMDQFSQIVCFELSKTLDELPYDITERLRAARVQAIEKRKQALLQTSVELVAYGNSATISAGHTGSHSSWWQRIRTVGLILVLMSALITINLIQDELRARELADIDTAILTDDLPPAAYVDAGFAQFLKNTNRHEQ